MPAVSNFFFFFSPTGGGHVLFRATLKGPWQAGPGSQTERESPYNSSVRPPRPSRPSSSPPDHFQFPVIPRPFCCPKSMISIALLLLSPLLLLAREVVCSAEPGIEKRMLSYADLMNNFGGPNSLDFFAPVMAVDEDSRPKREEGEDQQQQLGEDELQEPLMWKRAPGTFTRNYLMKKDGGFVAPGVLRFGKRMPGVLRFGKRDPVQEKKAVPGVLRFGKRAEGGVPGVLRFGKRMPQVLRFG